MTDRPSTIAEIWSPHRRTIRWHELWIEHLELQGADPEAIARYREADRAIRTDPRHAERVTRAQMVEARHEVVAALGTFNSYAGAQAAHLGLASSDITDPATQAAILDSLALVIDHAIGVAARLRIPMVRHAELKLVARTHGRPAQLTTWGHRQATVLGPLLDWIDRALEACVGYPMRPPTGAVGTGADLLRVLRGWRSVGEASVTGLGATGSDSTVGEAFLAPAESSVPDGPREAGGWRVMEQYAHDLKLALGFNQVADIARQNYHRSQDVRIASLLVELASLGQTWATDRRLEVMLGLGNEQHLTEQTASSSQAHKENPRFCERIVALSCVTRSHFTAMAELAGLEWLEGDVSTSAARKLVLPAMFQNIDDLLSNWAYVADLWKIDQRAIRDEVHIYRYELATPAIMQGLIDAGVARPEAHEILRQCWHDARTNHDQESVAERFERALGTALVNRGIKIAPQVTTGQWLRTVTSDLLAGPIGNVADQIDYLDRRAHVSWGMSQHKDWVPEVAL